VKLDRYTRTEVLGEKIRFHFTPASGLHKEEEFGGLCVWGVFVCVCVCLG